LHYIGVHMAKSLLVSHNFVSGICKLKPKNLKKPLKNSPDLKAVDYCLHLESDARTSLTHANTGCGRSAAEGGEHLAWLLCS